MKKLRAVLLSIVLVLGFMPFSISLAKSEGIKSLAFEDIDTKDGKPYLTLEEENEFSVLNFLTIGGEDGRRTGFIEEREGLTFSSSDETVIRLINDKLGIFSAEKVGEAEITCSAGKLKAAITIIVCQKSSLDNDGSLRTLGKKITAFSEKKITTATVIQYYNDLKSLGNQFSAFRELGENNYVRIPNQYQLTLNWDKLRAHLGKNKAIYYSGKPFSVKKISDVRKGSLKVTLSRKLNDNDIVAYAMINDKKCSTGLKMEFRTIFLKGKKGATDPYNGKLADQKKLTLKAGKDTFTVKLSTKIKAKTIYSVVISIDEYYGFTWTQGKYFSAR